MRTITEPCEGCGGDGLFTAADPESICPMCEGTGKIERPMTVEELLSAILDGVEKIGRKEDVDDWNSRIDRGPFSAAVAKPPESAVE